MHGRVWCGFGGVPGAHLAALIAAAFLALPARASESETNLRRRSEPEAMGAAALWENFSSALRRGNFAEAHACFSPASRRAFPFKAFAAHYHPLTAAYEATLSPVEEGQFRLCGDYAILRFVAAPPPLTTNASAADDFSRRRGVLVTALMVREEGRWWLVAAARERLEKLEAQARNLLRGLAAAPAVRNAWEGGKPLDAVGLAAAAPPIMRGNEAALCQQHYRFALAESSNGLQLQARALAPELRSFALAAPEETPQVWTPAMSAGEEDKLQEEKPPPTSPPRREEEVEAEERKEVGDTLPPPAPDLGDPSEMEAERRAP